jgi:hypothetical protein
MSATPLLDREQPLPTAKRAKKWWPLLIGAAIGIALEVSNVDLGKIGAFLPGETLLIWLAPALYFGVLVHELGHLVAGLSVGFEARALMVGAFLVTREAHGWKFRFAPRRMFAGGLTGMAPKSPNGLVDRYIRFTVGGPAASLMLLILTGVLILISPESGALHTLLFVDVLLVLSSGIPHTVRSHQSDAKLLLLLLGKGPASERLAAIMYLNALDTQGIQPRDWPRELIEKMSIPTTDKAFLMQSIFFRYADALDSGDSERIAEAIEHALSINQEAQPGIQRAFYVAASCFQSIFRGNIPLAEAWLESARKVKSALALEDWDTKAMAAIALAKGEREQARELFTRYLAMLNRRPPSGLVAAERARTVDLLGRSEGAAA